MNAVSLKVDEEETSTLEKTEKESQAKSYLDVVRQNLGPTKNENHTTEIQKENIRVEVEEKEMNEEVTLIHYVNKTDVVSLEQRKCHQSKCHCEDHGTK